MHKVLKLAAAAVLSLTLAACGGGDTAQTLSAGAGSGGSSGGSGGTGGTGGTGGSGGTTTPTYSMGNGSGGSFQSGLIGISNANLSAGGTTSLSISIVDQTGTLYTSTSPVTVTVNSPCFAQGTALIAPTGTTTAGSSPGQVTTSNGAVNLTYTAKGCSGPDIITANATVSGTGLTATGTVTVASASVGSLQFVSATPSTIGLKGTGLNETSTVVFKVVDSSGGPHSGVAVNFSLNTNVGGLTLSPASATSGSDGTVQTVVSSGTQHTAIRVTAVTTSTPIYSTQSSLLTVTTGLPASAAFSVAFGAPSYNTSGPACSNVEAYNLDLVAVPVTVQLADRYGNPAPDGTAVAFTTSGGHIGGSCATPLTTPNDGTCKVTWTSANPRPGPGSSPPSYRNGRAMILATAIGEESFQDNNGNGYWDTGEPFSNLGEPYRDDNESLSYALGEYFLDFDQNGSFTQPPNPAAFKGITCTGSTCSTTPWAIGESHLVIMSTGGAAIGVFDPATFPADPATAMATPPTDLTGATVTHGTTGAIVVAVEDQNGNPMAAGTTVSVTSDAAGTVGGQTSWTIGCRDAPGGRTMPGYWGDFTLISYKAGTTPGGGTITITVTSPGSKTVTSRGFPITIN
jgi:hypothetical protein